MNYRLRAWAGALGAAIGLSACGGGGGSTAAGSAELAQVNDLDGATQLAVDALQIANAHFLGIGPVGGSEPDPEPDPDPDPDPNPLPFPLPFSAASAKNTGFAVPCDSGSYAETERTESVDSPYGTAEMRITRSESNQCRQNDGPESDPQRHYSITHGASEFGHADDQGQSYSRVEASHGDGRLRYDYHYQDFETGERGQLTLHATVLRFEEKNAMHGDAYAHHRYDLEWRLGGRLQLRGVEALGSEQTPFRANQTDQGLSVSGRYERQFGDCARSQAEVATVTRLLFSNEQGHFIAGELRFSQGGVDSFARFDSAGQLHIQTSDGASRTLTSDELSQAGAACGVPVILTDDSE